MVEKFIAANPGLIVVVIGGMWSLILWLGNVALKASLTKINDNQDRFATMISEQMGEVRQRQDRLEEDHKETRTILDELVGQHKVYVKQSIHET